VGPSPFLTSNAGLLPFLTSSADLLPFLTSNAGLLPFLTSNAGPLPFLTSNAMRYLAIINNHHPPVKSQRHRCIHCRTGVSPHAIVHNCYIVVRRCVANRTKTDYAMWRRQLADYATHTLHVEALIFFVLRLWCCSFV